MPVTVKKVGNRYRVSTPSRVHARDTTKLKAERQERLLNAVDHGWKPIGRRRVESEASTVVNRLIEGLPIGSMVANGAMVKFTGDQLIIETPEGHVTIVLTSQQRAHLDLDFKSLIPYHPETNPKHGV